MLLMTMMKFIAPYGPQCLGKIDKDSGRDDPLIPHWFQQPPLAKHNTSNSSWCTI